MKGVQDMADEQITEAELDFIESCGVGESVCHAVPDLAGYFDGFAAAAGSARNLLPPDFAPHGGDGVAEGALRLGIPGGGSGLEERVGVEVVRPQGNEGEEAEERWGGAQDGAIGPLALGFQTEMSARFLEGDFELPAGDEPVQHLVRRDVE